MKKIDLSGKKSVKLLIGMVVFCVLLGMLAANSMKILSVTYLSNRKPAVTANGNPGGEPAPDNGGSVTPSPAPSPAPAPTPTPVPSPAPVNTTSSNGGVTSGALPTQAATDPQTTQAPETQAEPASSDSSENTEASQPESTTGAPATTEAPATTAQTTTEPATDSPAVAKEKKSILGEYKTVVNSSNSLRYGFTKKEYRAIEKQFLASLSLSRLESSFPEYFISADAPSEKVVAFGSEQSEFCIPQKKYACMTDTSKASDALLSATKDKQDDGSVKITLVLREEVNPAVTESGAKKAASYTSSIFDIIDADRFGEMVIASNITGKYDSIELKYRDCKAELVYMPASGRIVSLTHTVIYDAAVTNVMASIPVTTNSTVTAVTEYTNFCTAIDT